MKYQCHKCFWEKSNNRENEYVRVYFRINTPIYQYNIGFFSEGDRLNWHNEASRTISELGLFEGTLYDVERQGLKTGYLYAHPQEFSGVVHKNDVVKIAEKIATMELSTLEQVDLYETVYDISEEEYKKELDFYKNEIKQSIFDISSTSRRNQFKELSQISKSVASAFRIKRFCCDDGEHYGTGFTIKYVENLIEEMIKSGHLKFTEQNKIKYIRSLNKTEMKSAKLKI